MGQWLMAGEGKTVNPLLTAGRIVAMLAAASAGLSLPDDKLTLYDPAAPTKIVRFDAGLITAGQTRVVQFPDANIIAAGSASALTSGRMVFTAAGGLVADSANLTWNGSVLGVTGGITYGGSGLVASVNSGSTINADFTDTAASRTVAILRINTSATAHTSAALLDVVSSASTSADKMFRIRSNSTDRVTVNADGSTTFSGAVTLSSTLDVASTASFAGNTSISSLGDIIVARSGSQNFNIQALSGEVRIFTDSGSYLRLGANGTTTHLQILTTGEVACSHQLQANATTDSTSTTTGSLTTAGGLSWGAAKSAYGGFLILAEPMQLLNGKALRLSNPGSSAYASMAMNASNIVTLNYPFTGAEDILAETATAGVTRIIAARQTDNSNAASHSILRALVGGSSAGDPSLHLSINGVQSWSIGIDNSDSDSLKICRSQTIGTNTDLSVTTGGVTTIHGTADGILVVNGKITAKVAVPGSFADLAAVQTYLASILT